MSFVGLQKPNFPYPSIGVLNVPKTFTVFTHMSCLCLVILLCAACADATPAPLPTVEVVMGIFSGRPDPAWTLTSEQMEMLLSKLEALPAGVARCPPAAAVGP